MKTCLWVVAVFFSFVQGPVFAQSPESAGTNPLVCQTGSECWSYFSALRQLEVTGVPVYTYQRSASDELAASARAVARHKQQCFRL
jgi:hypothetical protein